MTRARVYLATAMLLSACSDTRLDYPDVEQPADVVDDELTVRGQFCTSPAADIAYPVKVMFIVDGSGSQQFSDQNRQRVVAVQDTINALIAEPNVFFKIIVFNASISSTPATDTEPVFTNDLTTLMPGLTNLAEADTVTDYQGALAVAYSELVRDMGGVSTDSSRGRAELGRTKYVVILISDGFPDPQCKIGLGNDFDPNFPGGVNLLCEDQDYINCLLEVPASVEPPGATCDFGSGAPCDPSCASNVCNFDGTACYRSEDASTLFGGLQTAEIIAGADYNQPYQILDKVQDIMELEERYDVGEIRLHTGLVLDPQADPAVIAIFGDPAQAVPLMQAMAESGQGSYMEFYGGDAISFLSINYDSLKQPRVVRGFFADNRAARVGAQGLAPDTDFDGLADLTELELRLSPRDADTDGDGYGDGFEEIRRAYGFDADDACKPALVDVPGADPLAPCDPSAPMSCEFELGPSGRVYLDSDRDGLHDCEERHLGTSILKPDTDHDGMPDRTELLYGTDPKAWDFERDDDQDSVPNGREIEWHLHPAEQQSEAGARDRYRYDRPQIQSTLDGRPCYDFVVRHIRLAPTIENDDLPPPAPARPSVGRNEIRLYILENMADDLSGPPLVRTACVRGYYVPPSIKYPSAGEVRLMVTDENDPDFGNPDADERFFKYLPSDDPIFGDPAAAASLFDESVDCVEAE